MRNARDVFVAILIVLLGVGAGLLLLLALDWQGVTKYKVILIAAILGLPAFLFFRDKEKFIVTAFLLALPVNPGMAVISGLEQPGTSIPYYYFQIRLTDVILVGLLCIRLAKICLYKTGGESASQAKVFVPFLSLIGAGAISLFPAVDKTGAFMGIIQFLRPFLVFFCFFHFCCERQNLSYFVLNCLLLGLFLQSVLMLAQFSTGSLLLEGVGKSEELRRFGETSGGLVFRPQGTMSNPLQYAKWSGVLLPIALAIGLTKRKPLQKLSYIFVWLCGSAALGLTISRAGIATWLLCTVVLLILLAHYGSVRRSHLVVALIMLVLGVAGIWLLSGENIRDRLEYDAGSLKGRLLMTEVALNVVKANPFIGVGLNNYTRVHRRYDTTPERISETFPYPVHNEYLLQAAETGIIGLGVFLWFLLRLMTTPLECRRFVNRHLDSAICLGVFVGILGILIQGLADFGIRGEAVHLSTLAALTACVESDLRSLRSASERAQRRSSH